MNRKITASRISSGNQLFPAQITLENNGISVKFPGFFNNKTHFIEYSKIMGVQIDTPLIGFSKITIAVAGKRITAHGFTKKELNFIKDTIDNCNTVYMSDYDCDNCGY